MIWEKIKTWTLVGLALALLFALGQWARMRSLYKETKRDLADEQARREAAVKSAIRERELKASHDIVKADLEDHLASIEVRRRSELDAAQTKREELNNASTDPDDLLALGRKKRTEGKWR
jgi:phage terminase Nu1 subunit (DNA packaging protein)